MLAPIPPQQRFLERARHWLVSLRRLLSAPGWNAELARQVERGLMVIEDYARNRRFDGVVQAVQSLRQDWTRLRVVERAPDEAARELLRGQAQRLFKAVAIISVTDGEQLGLPVYALLPERTPGAPVIHAFQAQGLHLQVYHDGDAIAKVLAERRPEALLVETLLAESLTELLDRLSPHIPGIGQLPIVALASPDDPQPRLHAALAGADLYAEAIEDPLLASRLRHLLAEYVREPYRVLIVDDDVSTGMLAQAVLQRAGFHAELAHDADAARSAMSKSVPDLVLMDLELPGESGLVLTASFREAGGAQVLPIVFLSGEDGEEARFQALRAGGDDFLVKPVRPRHLISMARARVKRARALTRQLRGRSTSARGHLRRGAFLEQLRIALQTPSADPVSLILLTIDDAASLRTRLGVVRSNELEHAVVDRVNGHLDADDTYCLLDEFQMAVLAERPSGDTLLELARSLVRSIGAEDFHDAGEQIALSASAGMARRPQQQGDLESWLQMSLAAMGAAHDLGGDRVEGLIDSSLPAASPERELRIRALLTTAAAGDWRFDYRPLIPLHSEQIHRYAVETLLRDDSIPAGGVNRAEYRSIARSLGLIEALDRHAVIAQIALLKDYAKHGQIIDLCMPVEPSSLAHLRGELSELPELATGVRLILELDADAALEHAELLRRFANQRLPGVGLGLLDSSGRFGHWPALLGLPVERMRLSGAALIDGVNSAQIMTQRWRASGRSLTADGIGSPALLSALWALGVDHVAGDGIALAAARPDFDFAAFGH
jgi:DNA-binding response OmpR family regulator/EAL domain-containing protein (putative c-di-GMP-specific phosphodiesterase class I)